MKKTLVLSFLFLSFRQGLVSVPSVRLDAHAVPEETLTATTASLVGRFAFEADVGVLHSAFQFGAAGVARLLLVGRVSVFLAAWIGRAGGNVAGASLVGTASIVATGAACHDCVFVHKHLTDFD